MKYCASAFNSHLRTSALLKKDENNIYGKYMVDTIHKLNDEFDYDFTILYNAYTEKENTETMKKLKEHGLKIPIYTDSGGLQINLTKTAKTGNIELEKLKVYKEQTLLSDYGMCFDEMPVYINDKERREDAHSRLDASGRYYIVDMVYDKGVQTGKNINKQIQVFKKVNAGTKIFVIIQGFTMDDYNLYAKGVYSQIPEEDYGWIEGVAIANTLTTDYFNAFDTYVRHQHHLEVPEQHKRHIHLLGVGGLNRIFPFLILKNKKDFWKEDFILNFDSSSATSSFNFGRSSFINEKNKLSVLKLGYDRNKVTDIHCEKLYEYHKDLISKHISTATCNSLNDFIENFSIFNSDKRRLKDDFSSDWDWCNINSQVFNSATHEIRTFFHSMDLLENHRAYHLLTHRPYIRAALLLEKINTIEDYMKNRDTFKVLLGTSRTAQLQRVQSMDDIDKKNAVLDVFNMF